ncbi:MAG: septation protein SpoVG family protein [Bacteroidota bacterium]
MRIVDMQLSDREGNIKAFFKIETQDGFTIEGFKVMNGRNGLFASMPSRKAGDRFVETVSASRELRNELSTLALEQYRSMGGSDSPSGPASGPSTDRFAPPPGEKDLPF